jgi:signal transduction histidine kinase
LAEIVRREMGRIDAIVGRMLNFVGSSPPEFRAISLHEVLEHSLRLVQPEREERQIALERSLQAAADQVKGDEFELQQGFVNLFLNALEAMKPNGILTVTTADEPGGLAGDHAPALRVSIRDTGGGISPEHQAKLFEPFFTTKPEGTGLGLAITQRIIQEHGGRVTVESPPGQGTTFHITLPLLGDSV